MNQTLALGYEILRTVELTTKYITKLTWNPVAVQSAAIAVSQIAANSSYWENVFFVLPPVEWDIVYYLVINVDIST